MATIYQHRANCNPIVSIFFNAVYYLYSIFLFTEYLPNSRYTLLKQF